MVKLIDFGIAHAADMAPMTQAGAQWGTPFYMPPEQWMGERGDTRSDVYSLGVVMYQMLSGQVPFNSTAANSLAQQNEIATQHLEVDPASLRSVREDIPEVLQAIVAKCMAKSPADRYQTPGELAAELAGVLDVETPDVSQPVSRPPVPVSAPEPVRVVEEEPRRNRLPLFAAGGFGAMIVIVLIVLVASQPSGGDPPSPRRPVVAPPVIETPTATRSPVPGPTDTPVAALMKALEPTATPEPTSTAEPTSTPEPAPTTQPTFTPLPTNTPRPTSTPVPTPTPYPVQSTFTPLPTSTPRPTSTPLPTNTPTFVPTATPSPTATPPPSPTPIPSPTSTHTPIPELPDLVLDDVSASTDSPEVWEEVSLTVSISNFGVARAGKFSVGLSDGSSILDEHEIGALEVNETKSVTFTIRAETQARQLEVVVDSRDEIRETNEANAFAYKLTGGKLPPYVIDKVNWHPNSPAINDEVTFWAHIENTSALSSEYNGGVVFYLNGEYHSSAILDERLNRNEIEQVKSSDEWEAQRGSHEITAVIYPLAYLDHRNNPLWREFDERYAIDQYTVTYNDTRLPNLVVTDVEVFEKPDQYADPLTLEVQFKISNENPHVPLTPSVDDVFNVLIVFEEGPFCPLRPGRIPCTEDMRIDRLGGGSEVTLTLEGEYELTRPHAGGEPHRFWVVVTVDPENEVEESDETDNSKPRVHRVTNN